MGSMTGTAPFQPFDPVSRRYTRRPLPPYRYLAGCAPHPRRDPRGHHFGIPEIQAPPIDPARWQACEEYLYGVDLYNYTFFWEAHESWEAVWKASNGQAAVFLQGLIQIAAALLKKEGGVLRGTRNLWLRGSAKLQAIGTLESSYCGIDLPEYLARMKIVIEAEVEKDRVWAADPRIHLRNTRAAGST
jgi:hypothetical protein